MREIVKDINRVMENKVQEKELHELVESLKKYALKRNISKVDSQKHVDLLLLISAILDIEEEEFEGLINRLNLIRLQRLGIFSLSPNVEH